MNRMKKMHTVKTIALVLTLTLAAGLFGGCGGDAAARDHYRLAWQDLSYPLADGATDGGEKSLCDSFVSENFVYTAYQYLTGVDLHVFEFFRYPIGGGDPVLLYREESDVGNSFAAAVDGEDNLWLYRQYSAGWDPQFVPLLIRIDAKGDITLSEELPSVGNLWITGLFPDENGVAFYRSEWSEALNAEQMTRYYFSYAAYQAGAAADEALTETPVDSLSGVQILDGFSLHDGRMLMRVGTHDIDRQTVQLYRDGAPDGDAITFTIENASQLNYYPGSGRYLFFVWVSTDWKTPERLYGYNTQTEQIEKIVCPLDWGVPFSGPVTVRENGEIVCVDKDDLYRLTPCTAQDAAAVLTMGAYNVWGGPIAQRVYDFNKTSPDLHIRITDYSLLEEDGVSLFAGNEGMLKLSTMLMSGDLPDMLCLAEGIPTASLARQGALVDLYPYLDADDQLGRDSFVEGILEKQETDGKLYQIASGFSLSTLMAKRQTVGGIDHLTMDGFQELTAAHPDQKPFSVETTRDALVNYFSGSCFVDCVNWETGVCSFGADVTELLKLAKTLPSMEQVLQMSYEGKITKGGMEELRDGDCLFMAGEIDSFQSLQVFYEQLGDDLLFVGFPSASQNGNLLHLENSFAITTACADRQAAWEFLRSVFCGPTNWFPTTRALFEQAKADAAGNPYTEQIAELIRNAKPITTYDPQIVQIIQTETDAFFKGKQSAEDAVAAIQERTSLYVQEQI